MDIYEEINDIRRRAGLNEIFGFGKSNKQITIDEIASGKFKSDCLKIIDQLGFDLTAHGQTEVEDLISNPDLVDGGIKPAEIAYTIAMIALAQEAVMRELSAKEMIKRGNDIVQKLLIYRKDAEIRDVPWKTFSDTMILIVTPSDKREAAINTIVQNNPQRVATSKPIQ